MRIYTHKYCIVIRSNLIEKVYFFETFSYHALKFKKLSRTRDSVHWSSANANHSSHRLTVVKLVQRLRTVKLFAVWSLKFM